MWQKISKWVGPWAAGEFLRTLVLPLLASGAGVVTGIIEGIPISYMFVVIAIMFASTMGGALWFDQLRDRYRVEHKLVFMNVKGTILNSEGGDIEAMRFGFDLRNISNTQICFRIDDMKTSVTPKDQKHKSFYPPNKKYAKTEITIPPTGVGWFLDHNIPLPKDLRGNAEAQMEFRISYGKIGNLKHSLESKNKTFFHLKDGGVTGGTDWYDQ